MIDLLKKCWKKLLLGDDIKMNFDLYKILSTKYVDDFQQGILYMNTLKYFQDLEGNEAQGDFAEGICGTISKNQAKQYGLYFDSQMKTQMSDTIFLRNEHYGQNNLFCMYCLDLDDEAKKIRKPSHELEKFYQNDDETVAVRVTDTKEFFRRVDAAIDKYCKNKEIEYGIRGRVVYSDYWLNTDSPGERSAFHKSPEYSYQNEWRLCILKYNLVQDVFRFSVGDLTDITEVITMNQFFSQSYPGYTFFDKHINYCHESYAINGSLNSVSKLMSAYSKLPVNVGYTDETQADWHFINYLRLTDRSQEIVQYLEKRFYETLDQEHLFLTVEYLMAKDEWVKATDFFAYCLNSALHVVEENPEKFFFSLHEIMMQNNVVEDAAKCWHKATNLFEIKTETSELMKSDWLFALGFYDKAIPIYLTMQEKSRDPILDFYLSVCYFYTLEFEQSKEHLDRYMELFASNPSYVEKSLRLKKLIDTFQNNVGSTAKVEEHLVQNLTWKEEYEQQLIENSTSQIYLGVDFLLLLTKEKKWHLLENAPCVIVCPLSIRRVVELHEETGDQLFHNAINNIKSLDNFQIQSSEPIKFLQLRSEKPDVPAYISMERACF